MPGILRLFFRKSVAVLAFVAGIGLISIPFRQLVLFLLFAFDSHIVDSRTTATALYHSSGAVGGRQRIQRGPSEIVFSMGKLVKLIRMTSAAERLIRHPGLLVIFG